MSRKTRARHVIPRLPVLVAAVSAVALALGLMGVALAASSPSPTAADDGGRIVLRVGWMQEPDNLNPFVGYQANNYVVWHMNYDFLVGFDDKDLGPRPELATDWEVSPDGKVWTFTLRDDATWQDGEPVTASDVAFTFNYVIENDLHNLATYTDSITRAEAVDDTHVKIYTSAPKANMLRTLVPILPEHIWSKVSGKAASTSYQNAPPIIGNGPFQVVEWSRGKYMRLVANKDYWGGAPKVDEVIFDFYTNADTMLQDLKLGVIDGAVDVSMAGFKQLQGTPGITTNEATSWSFNELAMNCYDNPDSKGNPVLLDVRFRQAVNYAVDREKVAKVAFQGFAVPGSTVIVPASDYHWEPPADQAFTYDPEKARQILDDAGYKDVDGDGVRETPQGKPLTLRLYATNDSVANQTAGKLIVGWLRDVGVKLDLQVMSFGALMDVQYEYTGDTFTPNWDMCVLYWMNEVDPNFMLNVFTPEQIQGWSDSSWTDPEYSKLNVRQMETIDPAERLPLVQEMQRIFYEDAAYAVLVYPHQLEAYNTRDWQGWVSVPSDAPDGEQGAVLYSLNNIDTYRFVEPKSAGATSASSSWVLPVVIAAVVAMVAAVVLVRRRRGHAETEAG